MKEKSKFYQGHKPLGSVFALILLCIFAVGSLLLVVLGANVYKNISQNVDSNFQFRTTLSYITTKVRQNDDMNSIKVVEKQGASALVLESFDGVEASETWIYEYEGSLCEVYVSKGTEFSLEDGLAIIPSYGLEMVLEEDILTITVADHEGNTDSLSIAPRTRQGGGLK